MNAALQRTRDEDCLSDFRLDLFLNGEVEEAHDSITEHLGACSRCADRLAELEADRQAYRESHVALPALVVERSNLWDRLGGRWLGGLALAGAAAAAVLVVAVQPEPGTRTKGSEILELYVKHGDAVRLGQNGEEVHPGDQLRFAVTLHEPRFVAVLSVDGAGAVSRYFPVESRMARIEPGTRVALPLATTLDHVLGAEAVYGYFCAAPVDVARLEASLGSGGAPEGCTLDVVRIEKRP